MSLSKFVVFALLAVVIVPARAAPPSPWRAISHHAVGGKGGWDLMTVDAAARRLYVTRGDHLMVLDADRASVIGDVSGLQRAHGVTVLPARHRGYVSSGGDNVLVVFDLDNFTIIDRIVVDHNPDAVIYDTHNDRVLVFNADSNSVSVVDPQSNRRVATIDLPGKPELAVTDDKGNVYVNLEDVAKVARLNVAASQVASVFALPGCEEPTGLAIDVPHERLFSVCQNRTMIVTDAHSGRHVASIPIGAGPDGAVFAGDTADALSSNSDGTLTIVHEVDPDHFVAEQTLSTPPRSRCITIDAKTHRAILATAKFAAAAAATPENPHPRPTMLDDSFGILIVGRH